MTTPELPTPARAPAPRFPRAVLAVVACLGLVQFLQWTVVLPEDVQAALGFRRANLELGRWWTALTFPLAHRDAMLALLNAYVLVVFGTRLAQGWGARRFLAFLGTAGLAAWVLQMLSGSDALLLGASAAAFGTLAAYAMRWGGDTHLLLGGFQTSGHWLAVLVGALLLLTGLRSGPGGGLGFLVHLGGIGAAWLFVRATPGQLVERLREGVSALPDEPPEDELPRAIPKTPPRSRARDRESIDDVLSRANAASARRASPRRRVKPEVPPAPPSIDAILDKISAEGMDRLTDEERRVLDDHSRRLRDQ